MGASFNARSVSKRIELKQRDAIGPMSRISGLLALPDIEECIGASLTEVYRKCGGLLSEQEIEAEVVMLKQNRFVRVDHHGYQRVNGWIPLQDRLVAVELKLDRVDDALSQARKNKELTWESYVGLPSAVAVRVIRGKKRNEFGFARIGLLGIDGRGVRRLLPARPTGMVGSPVVKIQCVERFWRDHLQAVEH